MNENPYAAPSAAQLTSDDPSSSVAIRQKHLKHEASVKSIGTLFILSGLISCGASVVSTMAILPNDNTAFVIGHICGGLLLSLLPLWIGLKVRRLKKRFRIPAIVLSALGLIIIPIGTLISIYALYLLCSSKGSVVFSPAYQQVISETPEIKYRTSIVTWILLFLLITVFIVAAIYNSSS